MERESISQGERKNHRIKKKALNQIKGGTGLVGYGVTIRIGRFSVQTPLKAWLGLVTHPHYKACGDPQVKIVKNAVINIRLVRLSP